LKILVFSPLLTRFSDEYIFKVGQFYFFFTLEAGGHEFVNKSIRTINANNMSAINKSNTVAQYFGFIHIVSGNNYCCSLITYLTDQIPKIASGLRI